MSKKLTPKQIRNKQLEEIRKEYPPKYEGYTYDKYVKDLLDGKIHYIENMSAKEPLNDEALGEMLNSEDYYAEEKEDGVRADIQFTECIRSFSRRISKKTDWYSENTDSLPHIRDLEYLKELKGTVLDGEYRIVGEEFKEISSLMNCNYDEAILRQKETGKKPTFIAFDILYYKGINVMKMPLKRRKDLLAKIIKMLPKDSHIVENPYTDLKMHVQIKDEHLHLLREQGLNELYPTLDKEIGTVSKIPYWMLITKQAWYEFILLKGGEGLMLKPKEGKYYMKRGREYTKYKKFDTWDVIIMGYNAPTKEYTGKELNNNEALWGYWYNNENDKDILIQDITMQEAHFDGLLPCTKHYAKGWIGTVEFGVVINNAILEDWKKRNPKEKPITTYLDGHLVLCVGDTSGFTEETRQYITENKYELLGKVIEVEGHERIKKTSKIRHPRFLRFREDKSIEECTWEDHQH